MLKSHYHVLVHYKQKRTNCVCFSDHLPEETLIPGSEVLGYFSCLRAEHLGRQIKHPDITTVSTQSSFTALTVTFHFITIQRQLWNTHLQKRLHCCVTAYSFAVSVFMKDLEVPVYTLSCWDQGSRGALRSISQEMLNRNYPCSRKHWISSNRILVQHSLHPLLMIYADIPSLYTIIRAVLHLFTIHKTLSNKTKF